jgi:acetylornithine deacetylase/succinyl-diaminopimelate desuccinylase-like protein
VDRKIAELAKRYLPLARQILEEAIRIPADYVDIPAEEGGDPRCGLSNHEGPRMEYLRRAVIEAGAVESEEDVGFDAYGNLWWSVSDKGDGVPTEDKAVVWMDGHCDTVAALRPRWHEAIGGGIDAYDGMVDPSRVDRSFLNHELGWVPFDAEWEHLIFGRGGADQLGGVICQIIATKILLELRSEGALRGVVVRGIGTVCEEDNDGGGPMHLMKDVLPNRPPHELPDVVILSEGTGCSRQGAVAIYRGQRGRMQIEVEVTGRSCHGSMPWEGLNPLEFGARILAEASDRYDAKEGFTDHPFLGRGSRTASFAKLDTPSDCAVPERFIFRFDRRLTAGEEPDDALAQISELPSVARAREAGLGVDVRVPVYGEATWRGHVLGNPQIYPGWVTPADHCAIATAVESYRRVCSPQVENDGVGGGLRKEPRVDRWVFSTDGVGFPIPVNDDGLSVPAAKRWIEDGSRKYPAMFGIGPGIEQNTHKIGECVDSREIPLVVAFMARFPSLFAKTKR